MQFVFLTFKVECTRLLRFEWLKSSWWCSGLTNYLKKVGKQDDLLGGPRSVRPVAKQRSRQEAAQAER